MISGSLKLTLQCKGSRWVAGFLTVENLLEVVKRAEHASADEVHDLIQAYQNNSWWPLGSDPIHSTKPQYVLQKRHHRDQAATGIFRVEDILSITVRDAVYGQRHKQKQRVVTVRHLRRHCETKVFEQCGISRTYPHTSGAWDSFIQEQYLAIASSMTQEQRERHRQHQAITSRYV